MAGLSDLVVGPARDAERLARPGAAAGGGVSDAGRDQQCHPPQAAADHEAGSIHHLPGEVMADGAVGEAHPLDGSESISAKKSVRKIGIFRFGVFENSVSAVSARPLADQKTTL